LSGDRLRDVFRKSCDTLLNHEFSDTVKAVFSVIFYKDMIL